MANGSATLLATAFLLKAVEFTPHEKKGPTEQKSLIVKSVVPSPFKSKL